MEFEVSVENEQQFWNEIQEIVSAPCSSEDLIDNTLRAYLSLATKYKDDYLPSELEVTRCLYKLLSSTIFVAHTDYVRRQMIYGLLQEDDLVTLHLMGSFLLFDGRQHEVLLHMMNEEGMFPRLLELLQGQNKHGEHNSPGLHRLLMDLLYEMSRIQRVKIEDLVLVDDDFISGLFDIIEDLSYDVNDPYHYPVIRVLLVLNEQFMISAHNPVDQQSPSNVLTNKVIKVLSMHGNLYKTFGENIILLINREAETSLQLLTLKLLYLIFTTPNTFEYFFTNDLHVLVDILIRNLLDLPEEASALRHTYLRVLYPLLAHTQLKYPPHYKRVDLKRMLNLLVRGQLSGEGEADCEKIMHFDDVDDTTKRLVLRCAAVEWLQDKATMLPSLRIARGPQREDSLASEAAVANFQPGPGLGVSLESSQTLSPTSTRGSSPEALSPTTQDELDSSASTLDTHPKPSQIQRLGMHLEPASSSSLSVHEVASQHEKPGVITPSRTDTTYDDPSMPTTTHTTIALDPQSSPTKAKVKPLPPKTRRWRGRRTTGGDEDISTTIIAPTEKFPETLAPSPPEEQISPLAPSTPIIAGLATPQLIPETDRRNSTTTSGLAPPVPHARRSASNPPPAVPPPRRSVIHHHLSSHCTPVTSPSRLHLHHPHHNSSPNTNQNTPGASHKQVQKPEPPKARRWGRSRHGQTESADSHLNPNPNANAKSSSNSGINSLGHASHNSAPNLHQSGYTETTTAEGSDVAKTSKGPEGPTVSVEEAVQNVSLHS